MKPKMSSQSSKPEANSEEMKPEDGRPKYVEGHHRKHWFAGEKKNASEKKKRESHLGSNAETVKKS